MGATRQQPAPARPDRGRDSRGRGGRRPRLRRPTMLQVGMVASAVSFAWFLSRWAYPFGPPVLSWLLVPVTPALGALATIRVARLPGLTPAAVLFWRSLAISGVLISLGIVSLAYDSLTGPGAPREYFGPVTALIFILGIAVVLWVSVRLPMRKRSRHEWITVGLDIGIVIIAAGLVLVDVAARNLPELGIRLAAILLLALLGVAVAVKVSLTGATGIDRRAMRLLAANSLVGTLMACGSPLLADRPDLNAAMPVVPLLYAGVYYAAELQRRATVAAARTGRRRRQLPFSLLPYAAIACSNTLLLSASGNATSVTSILTIGSVALTALVIVRQMIAFFDNRRYQDLLAHRATHDDLTGLANRALFRDRTEQALSGGTPGTVAVALVDLDEFKSINDRLGHGVGDALIAAVGDRLRTCVRPADTVARLGGDEFVLLLTGLRPGDSSTVAGRVLAALAAPVNANGHDLLVQASIGLADNAAGAGGDELLRRADLAMYAAKESGKNRYAHYDADMEARTVEHAQVAADLTRAIERDELYMLYQPIVDMTTGRVVAAEALIRWRHPRHGTVSPATFIPVAEQTGLIVPIGAWALRTACAQAAGWRRRLGDRAPERITVNVSARQLLDPEFARTVAAVLAETGLEPAQLTAEITETAVFGGGRASQTVEAIHALGVGIALDDFGTGHSSLGLLRTCPVDVLKVDKSFVDDITRAGGQDAIMSAVIEIARALGLRAIAEGVETWEQAKRLRELGYRLAQGFHYARPLPAAEVEAMLTAADRSPVAA